MLTLTIQGNSLDELRTKVASWLEPVAAEAPRTMETTKLASGATLLKDTTVAAEETPAPKKRGPKPKETMVVTRETIGPEKIETFLPDAKPASAATYDSMRKSLQELAGKYKTNEEGMNAVSKLLLEKFQIKMVRDVPADKYQAVQDAVLAATPGAASDPFGVK
jgi:hypothetical protein